MIKTKEIKKKKIKNDKGITLVSLIIVIIVLFIIASVGVSVSYDRFEINKYKKMKNDIELLSGKISNYYLKYNGLPLLRDDEGEAILFTEYNGEEYYIIDLEAMEGITLNYGRDGYEELKQTKTITQVEELDLYIINKNTNIIYYVKGVTVEDNTYYTLKEVSENNLDNIPPTKPQINVVSGIKNEEGIYLSDVKIEIVGGKDNWTTGAIENTCYVNGEEIDISTIHEINSNGTYEIIAESKDNNGNVSTSSTTIKVNKINKGDFIDYNVSYTDMNNSNYIYTSKNGWRLVDYTLNDDGTLSNVKLISTGIPGKVETLCTDIVNNSWFIEDSKFDNFKEILGRENFNFYEGEEIYYAMNLTGGLYYNFKDIKFAYATGSRGENLGFFTSINTNGTTYDSNNTVEKTGEEIFNIYGNNATVRLLTLPELNKALNREDIDSTNMITNTEDSQGIYLLTQIKQLENMSSYVYTGGETYLLATPYPGKNASLTFLIGLGAITFGDNSAFGIRPLVCLKQNVSFLDSNNDNVWEIKF